MDHDMNYGNDYKYIPVTSVGNGMEIEILPDLLCYTIQVVNMCLVRNLDTNDFVLVDAGMPNSADKIISFTEKYFGENNRPNAIILTHGHFDHVGAVIDLVKHWEIPVYAHELEIPYLTGKRS